MWRWWSERVVSWRKQVLIVAAVGVVAAAVWGTSVFGHLGDGGFDDPHAQSSRATHSLHAALGRTDADLIVLVTNPTTTVDEASYRAAVTAGLATLPAGSTTRTVSYWTTNSPAFVSADRHSTYVAITLTDPDERKASSAYDPLRSALSSRGYTAQVGGLAVVNDEINTRVGQDIARAESFSMPILLVLLIVIFGGVVAASLPLLVGGISILGAFAALRTITLFTDVSVFAVNIVTIMGLGLAIDYGLFMVGRFREEIAHGHDAREATRRTVLTAGRTVAISAITVAVALSGLTMFPQMFLRSMGFGGVAAILVAAVGAVGVLPAVLATLGPRIEKWPVRIPGRRRRIVELERGFWYRLAHSVMRRPTAYLLASAAVLLLLAVPFLHVTFGGIDARTLPTSSQARHVSETLQDRFPGSDANPVIVAARYTDDGALNDYAAKLAKVPGASSAEVIARKDGVARIDVGYPGQTLAPSTKTLVREVRQAAPPDGVQSALVGGETALLVDRLDGIGSRLPIMGIVVGLASFALLFFAFGSLLLPIKAIVLNILSLGASFGVVTWIFQDGHFASWLNFTSTGSVEATQPILVLAIVFGLSMDYEVFLLSRVREEYDRTGDNRAAVAAGLQRTGGIITSAALLIIVVIGFFSASQITFIKLIGVAMATAIVVDALLVRMIVVPAAMRLLGEANWWAPSWMRSLYRRYGFRGSGEDSPSAVTAESNRSRITSATKG